MLKETGAFVSIVNSEAGYNPTGHPPFQFASFFCLRNDSSVQDELAKLVAEQKLQITIDTVYPFTDQGLRAMLNNIQAGTSRGKNVVKIL